MVPRWKLFPRQIECDLSLYHGRDIGEWHVGTLSSRKLLILLDGLPGESWYKLSVHEFITELAEEEERDYCASVGNLIYAQLHGQEVSSGQS